MGYVVPNRALGAALWARLQDHPSVELRAPCRVVGLVRESHCVNLTLDDGSTLAARLVVAADGAVAEATVPVVVDLADLVAVDLEAVVPAEIGNKISNS